MTRNWGNQNPNPREITKITNIHYTEGTYGQPANSFPKDGHFKTGFNFQLSMTGHSIIVVLFMTCFVVSFR